MEPLIALTAVGGLVLLVARRGQRPRTAQIALALRAGLTAMFVLTGTAHFLGMRDELVAMVPEGLPSPGLLVTVTGVLELVGVAGLWVRPVRIWAGLGLAALLVAMFPANVHHALNGAGVDVMEQLFPRTVLQVVFLGAVLALVSLDQRRARQEEAEVARSSASAAR